MWVWRPSKSLERSEQCGGREGAKAEAARAGCTGLWAAGRALSAILRQKPLEGLTVVRLTLCQSHSGHRAVGRR